MKKALIAGAASTVLAAMPVLGVFATETPTPVINDTPMADVITATLAEVCTLSRDGHTNPTVNTAQGTWTPTSGSVSGVEAAKTDTFAVDLAAGVAYAGIATSKFNIACNNADNGYQVTVEPTAFVGSGSEAAWTYDGTAAGMGATSTWNITSSQKVNSGDPGSSALVNLTIGESNNYTKGIVWSSSYGSNTNPITTGSSFTVTYNLYPVVTQQAGQYTASAKYNLAAL